MVAGRALADRGVAALAEVLGQPLSLDERGLCALAFTGGLQVVLELPESAGGELRSLYLRAVVAPLPPEPAARAALAETALALNLYGIETDGATLALDTEAGEIVLWWAEPAEALNPDALPARVAAFTASAERLRDRLGAPTAAARSPVAAGATAAATEAVELARFWVRG